MALRKYPRTYHLPWSQGSTDDDKTHSLAAIERMFGGREVVITEKMDGENTTIYGTGECHARSLDSGKHPSRDYVRAKAREVAYMGLPEGWRIMGENLYAKHSIEYDLLPDYFVIFGVADENDYSRPWDEVEEWAELLEMPHAPVVWRGIWNTEEVMGLYPFKSMLSSTAPSEGYVVRVAGAFPMSQFDKNVAKFVRSGHVQPDAVHWMHQSVTPNKRRKNPLTTRVENMAGRPLRRARLAAQAPHGASIAPATAAAPNSRTVNRALAEAGIPVTLYKGKGYFYIEAADGTQVDSIYVPYWDDYTVAEWVEHVRYEYEQARPQPLDVGSPARRRSNPSPWGPHHEAYYNHPSVRDHVAVRITAKGREALAKMPGRVEDYLEKRLLALLADTPSLPQFIIEGEFGIGNNVLSDLLDAGLIAAFIEAKPARPPVFARPEYPDDEHDLEYEPDLEYLHREMLRLGRMRSGNPPDLATAAREALVAAGTAMDHFGLLKRALYEQPPFWSAARRVAADSLRTPELVSAAHDAEMAVHAASDAGTLPRAVVKDLAFDVQVASQRAARSSQALCTRVLDKTLFGALYPDLASAINVADRDLHNAYLACNALFSAVVRPR